MKSSFLLLILLRALKCQYSHFNQCNGDLIPLLLYNYFVFKTPEQWNLILSFHFHSARAMLIPKVLCMEAQVEWILTKLVKLRRFLLRSLSVLFFSALSGSKQVPGQHVWTISVCRHSVSPERWGTSFSPMALCCGAGWALVCIQVGPYTSLLVACWDGWCCILWVLSKISFLPLVNFSDASFSENVAVSEFECSSVARQQQKENLKA